MNVTQIAHLLDDNGIAMLVLDTEQNICRINKTAAHLLNRQPESLIGKSLRELIPRLFNYNGVLRQGYVQFEINRHIYVNSYSLKEDKDGEKILVTLLDMTRQVMCDIYTHIYNLLPESIVLYDAKGKMISMNDACTVLEGLLPADALGKHVTELYRVLDKSGFVVLQTLTTRKPLLNHIQLYATQQGGRVVEGLSNIYPIFLNEQLFGTVSITQDHARMDELERKAIALESKLKMLSGAKASPSSKKFPTARYYFRDIICGDPKMVSLLNKCKLAAKSDSSVMLYGETGTGKELFAQSIHTASRRADKPFVAVNCAAIPDNLLESMLFGTVKGAFTGAENQTGLFEQAHTGTLLLDELNSMSMALQSKLLRVLQEGVVRRLGSSSDTFVDVRVISNINVPPLEAVEKGILRSDLFYRLGVVSINILPLRERNHDILLLAKNYIIEYNRKLLKNVTGWTPEVEQIFLQYKWPGNVRELAHAIEHAMNIMPDNSARITARVLPDHILEAVQPQTQMLPEPKTETEQQPQLPVPPPNVPVEKSLTQMMEEMERGILLSVLERHGGNISHAARELQTSRQQLKYRLDKYGIESGRG